MLCFKYRVLFKSQLMRMSMQTAPKAFTHNRTGVALIFYTNEHK